MKKIYIVVGGLQPQWLGRRIAQWVRVNTKKQTNASVTIVDIEDITLAEREARAHDKRKYDIAEADGFILIAPDYESGKQPAVDAMLEALKQESLSDKPVAFVSYGLDGGAKLVDSMRSKVRKINLAPLRNAVHIPKPWEVINQDGELHDRRQERHLSQMIKQLNQWISAAKVASVSV